MKRSSTSDEPFSIYLLGYRIIMNAMTAYRSFEKVAGFLASSAGTFFILGLLMAADIPSNSTRINIKAMENMYGMMPGYFPSDASCECAISSLPKDANGQPSGQTDCSCATFNGNGAANCVICVNGIYQFSGYYSTGGGSGTYQPSGGTDLPCTGSAQTGACANKGCVSKADVGGCNGTYPPFTNQNILVGATQ